MHFHLRVITLSGRRTERVIFSRDFFPVYVALVQNSAFLFRRLVSGFYWNIRLEFITYNYFSTRHWETLGHEKVAK